MQTPSVKIWTSNERDDDKIIAYLNETIYKINPPSDQMDNCIADLKMQNISVKNCFGIPLHYITEINQQEGKDYIEILFRQDTEHLKIQNHKTRDEIFDFFKENVPGTSYALIKPSPLASARKPLIAMGVIAGIFLWSYFISAGLESGDEYELTPNTGRSLGGVVLVLASLGRAKLILIFGTLFLIALYVFIKKYRIPVVKHTLSFKRQKL